MRERVRRLDEQFQPEGDPPRGVLMLDGRWVKILWHPDDVERTRALGVDVDALDRVELPDGRTFPLLGFGPDDAKPPPLPGSPLAGLDEVIRRRSEPRVEVEVPVVAAPEVTPPAPIDDDDDEEEETSWTL